jgi:hypothetical protein
MLLKRVKDRYRGEHITAQLFWCEAQDGGDPITDIELRDVVYQMPVQNRSNLQLIAKTKLRYLGITKGTSEIAVLSEGWW